MATKDVQKHDDGEPHCSWCGKASPIWWVAISLMIYGILLGLYPED